MTQKNKPGDTRHSGRFQAELRQQLFHGDIWARLYLQLKHFWSRIAARSIRRETHLRVVEMVGLGEKRFVAVVEYRGDQFLLGGAPGTVCLLSQLHQPVSSLATTSSSKERKSAAPRRRKNSASLSQAETRNIVALLTSPLVAPNTVRSKRKRPSSSTSSPTVERFA